jgi:hypothetical protein
MRAIGDAAILSSSSRKLKNCCRALEPVRERRRLPPLLLEVHEERLDVLTMDPRGLCGHPCRLQESMSCVTASKHVSTVSASGSTPATSSEARAER